MLLATPSAKTGITEEGRLQFSSHHGG